MENIVQASEQEMPPALLEALNYSFQPLQLMRDSQCLMGNGQVVGSLVGCQGA